MHFHTVQIADVAVCKHHQWLDEIRIIFTCTSSKSCFLKKLCHAIYALDTYHNIICSAYACTLEFTLSLMSFPYSNICYYGNESLKVTFFWGEKSETVMLAAPTWRRLMSDQQSNEEESTTWNVTCHSTWNLCLIEVVVSWNTMCCILFASCFYLKWIRMLKMEPGPLSGCCVLLWLPLPFSCPCNGQVFVLFGIFQQDCCRLRLQNIIVQFNANLIIL